MILEYGISIKPYSIYLLWPFGGAESYIYTQKRWVWHQVVHIDLL